MLYIACFNVLLLDQENLQGHSLCDLTISSGQCLCAVFMARPLALNGSEENRIDLVKLRFSEPCDGCSVHL